MGQTPQDSDVLAVLNAPPFNLDMSLVDLGDCDGQRLLDLILVVIEHINPDHAQVMRAAIGEERARLLLEFLLICEYGEAVGDRLMILRQGVLSLDVSALTRVLYFLASRLPVLRDRVYQHQFLRTMDIPPQYKSDSTVQNIMQQLDESRGVFRQLIAEHKTLSGTVDVVASREGINRRLEEVKELQTRIRSLEQTLEREGVGEEFISSIEQIAKQVSSRRKTETQLETQKRRVAATRLNLDAEKSRAARLETLLGANADIVVETLREEVNTLEKQCAAADQQASLLTSVWSVVEARSDPDSLISRLESEVRGLERKMEAANADEALTEQLRVVRQHNEGLQSKIAALQQDESQQKKRLTEVETRLREAGVDPSGDLDAEVAELKKYAEQNQKAFQQNRKMHQALSAEIQVLSQTLDVLRSLVPNADQILRDRLGDEVTATTMTSQLAQHSKNKRSLDEEKVEWLTELTNLVKQLHLRISERQSELAPLVQQLKELQSLEASLRDRVDARFKVSRPEGLTKSDVELLEKAESIEMSYHFFNSLQMVLDLKRSGFESVRDIEDRVESQIGWYSMQTRDLESKGEALEEQLDDAIHQGALYQSLRDLLTAKARAGVGAGTDMDKLIAFTEEHDHLVLEH